MRLRQWTYGRSKSPHVAGGKQRESWRHLSMLIWIKLLGVLKWYVHTKSITFTRFSMSWRKIINVWPALKGFSENTINKLLMAWLWGYKYVWLKKVLLVLRKSTTIWLWTVLWSGVTPAGSHLIRWNRDVHGSQWWYSGQSWISQWLSGDQALKEFEITHYFNEVIGLLPIFRTIELLINLMKEEIVPDDINHQRWMYWRLSFAWRHVSCGFHSENAVF